MPRDKFAAMASRANISKATASDGDIQGSAEAASQQQEQQAKQAPAHIPAPKRDKMAALASRSKISEQDQKQDASATKISDSPPKRDKMAALAARLSASPSKIDGGDGASQSNQHHEQSGGLTKTSNSPPKRDKMAALAARSNIAPSEPGKNNAEVVDTNQQQQQQQQKDENSDTSVDVAPKRDKLAALASRSKNNVEAAPSRNDNLAKLTGTGQSASTDINATTGKAKSEEDVAAEAAIGREKHLTKLKDRLSKRKGILNCLDRAEKLTCKLLKIAAKTTDSLQDLNYSPHLSQLSVAYRSTLQELHPLLTMGTEELIKPYQNHTKETKQSMYAARVEMRLAKERLEVLKTFSALEKASREREDQVKINDINSEITCDETDRKRKR